MLINGLFLTMVCAVAFAEHPALAVMKLHSKPSEGIQTINPYTLSIFALYELKHERNSEEVRQFILWYFGKLNYPDRNGLTGSVYDYELENGQERSTNQYDSVDGYAGLFLHLLHVYAVKTGDIKLVRDHWKKIEDIAYLIPFLQGKDSLTVALPGRHEKYLMDNCEAYGGISAFLALQNLAGKTNTAYYERIRMSIRQAIVTRLYEPKKKIFSWAIENDVKSRSQWKVFYPDAYAQLFPIYYNLLTSNPRLKRHLWNEFNRRYKAKVSGFPVEQRLMYELTALAIKENK